MPHDVLLVRMDCSSTRHPQVARFVRGGEAWILVGVSLQRPGSSFGEAGSHAGRGPDSPEATGQFLTDQSYAGCPSCGSDAFVRCGRCHELNCWDRSWPRFDCPRCRNSGPVSGEITSLHGSGRD